MLEAGGNSASHRVPAVESLTTSKYQALRLANGTVAPKSLDWEVGFSEVQSAPFRARQKGAATPSSPQQCKWAGPAIAFPQLVTVPEGTLFGWSRISVKTQITLEGRQLRAALQRSCKGPWEQSDFTRWASGSG